MEKKSLSVFAGSTKRCFWGTEKKSSETNELYWLDCTHADSCLFLFYNSIDESDAERCLFVWLIEESDAFCLIDSFFFEYKIVLVWGLLWLVC